MTPFTILLIGLMLGVILGVVLVYVLYIRPWQQDNKRRTEESWQRWQALADEHAAAKERVSENLK